MSAQSVVGLPPRDSSAPGLRAAGRAWNGIRLPVSRRAAVSAALVGFVAALLAYVGLSIAAPRFGWFAPASTAPAQLGEGSPWPSPVPVIRSSELWYAT